MAAGVKYPDITVNLTDSDGNVFMLMARVGGALKRAGLKAEADEFYADAKACGGYDEVLRLIMRTVETT